jgi:hypothetical protein
MEHEDEHRLTTAKQTSKEALTRRGFLRGAVQTTGGALAASGIYALVDTFASPPARATSASTFLPEQHLLQDEQVILTDGSGTSSSTGRIAVTVPPLHHLVVTANLNVAPGAKALQQAQAELESTLQNLEQTYSQTSRGLGITVVWGRSYFRDYIPRLGKASSYFPAQISYPDYLPIDQRTSRAMGQKVHAILDAVTFPSDQPPPGFSHVILEQNDVAVLLRSDSLDNITVGANAIFGTGPGQVGELFNVTSIRKGFAGGGFYGGQSLPSRMALAAKIPAAEKIPTNAELFLGFTSTQQASLGPTVICNLESLPGLTDQWPNGYFRHGTTMHLSHLFEDLQGWYKGGNSVGFSDRVRAAFRPGLSVPTGTISVSEDPTLVASETGVLQDLKRYGAVGHSASLQPATRLQQDVIDNYGNVYSAGTTVPQRADFNTLDNPFHYSANTSLDRYSSSPAAGLHFVIFSPTSEDFHRWRRAMDGYYPDGTVLNLHPRSSDMGFNAVLTTTHRQNFLVPPRAHRSFPLAEYLV